MDDTERFIVDSKGIVTSTGYLYTCLICREGLSTEQDIVPIDYDRFLKKFIENCRKGKSTSMECKDLVHMSCWKRFQKEK